MDSTNKISLSVQREYETATSPPSLLEVTENDDLLTAILSRLPTRSAVRFKSVSKHWFSLISHPSFSLLHTTSSPVPTPSSVLFPTPGKEYEFHFLPLRIRNYTSPPFTSLNFTNDPSGDIEILQSCNGLLLCSTQSPWDGIETRVFYIFNPTTKRFSTIPPPPPTGCHVSLSIFTKISLAFDPSRSPDYKVVLVRKAGGCPSLFQLNVYYSKTRTWRRCGHRVEWPCFEVFSKGVYWNGALHWASKRDGFVCFDTELEVFKAMPPLPGFTNPDNGRSTVRYLGESGGHLYMVDARPVDLDVFEMETDYSNWVPRYRVDLIPIYDVYPCVHSQSNGYFCVNLSDVSVISLEGEGNCGGLCLLLHVPGKILGYNLERRGIKVIQDGFAGKVEANVPALVRGFGGYSYFESLACV